MDGSSQTGNTLLARGCTASQSPWLRIGDYFHYVSPSWQQMHRVVSDVASDSSGHASLTIEPAIRESPAAGAAIITSSPQAIMRLLSDDVPLEFTPPVIGAFTIDIEECFS